MPHISANVHKDGKREVVIARIYRVAKWRPVSSLRDSAKAESWQSIFVDSAESSFFVIAKPFRAVAIQKDYLESQDSTESLESFLRF